MNNQSGTGNKLSRLNFLFSCVVAMPVVAAPAVDPSFIDVTRPTNGGQIRFALCVPDGRDCDLTNGNDANSVRIRVVLTGNETPAEKAELIANAINDVDRDSQGRPLNRFNARVGSSSATNASVRVENTRGFGVRFDSTHEHDRIRTVRPPPPPPPPPPAPPPEPPKVTTATLDFHLFGGSVLAGTSLDGFESQFQSSLGFDGIVADASFSFSGLNGNTIEALLTATYNSLLADLPADYWSSLSLDLTNEAINFVFPDSASNLFVDNFTSDANGYATLSLNTVIPEPATWSLCLLWAAGLAFADRRSRRQSHAAV